MKTKANFTEITSNLIDLLYMGNTSVTEKSPAISILVPCCNVEKYLEQCLESIVSQSFEDLEIICINDGSKDGTLKIIRDFAARDSRIVVIDKPNSGYGASMNIGLDRAKGKYIGIVESDDFIEKDMFKRLYDTAEEYGLDYVRCLFRTINEVTGESELVNFEDCGLYKCNEVFNPFEQKNIFYTQPSIWAGLYRRDMIKDNHIRFLETPGASYQDTAFSFKVYCVTKKMMVIREYLHNYRINPNSSVSSTGKVFCVCEEEAEIRRFAAEHGLTKKLRGVMAMRAFGSYKWNYKRLAYKQKRQFIKQWSKEAKQWFADGEMTREHFSKGRLFRLWMVAYTPWIFYFSKQV